MVRRAALLESPGKNRRDSQSARLVSAANARERDRRSIARLA